MPALAGPGTFESFFGNAIDGNADFSGASGGTLDRPSYLDTVTVGGPKGLEVAGNPIFCRRLLIDSSQLQIGTDGAIHCNGGHGSTGSSGASGAAGGFFGGGGAGGAGGQLSPDPGNQGFPGSPGEAPPGFSLGGAGGAGGAGSLIGIPGGAGGGPTSLPAPYNRFCSFFTALTGLFAIPGGLVIPCGGGGGGGGGSTGGSAGFRTIGGPGGGAGGIVLVCVAELVLTGGNPHFCARGGNGGSAGFSGSGAGGGAGGAGGAILLAAAKVTGDLVTNIAGGQGGSGNGGHNGDHGVDGSFQFFAL